MEATGVRKKQKGRWLSHLLTAHGVAGYLFLYLPIVILVIYSFNVSRYASGAWRGFSLQWYATLFSNEAIGIALKNTLIVAGASTLISTVFGTMVALAMERHTFQGKLALDALLYLPIIIPDISMAVMLLLFFVLTRMSLGLITIIISHVAFNISFVAVVVRARLAYFDASLEEAAQDLYANQWQTFWRVSLPMMMGPIIVVAVTMIINALKAIDLVLVMTEGGPRGATRIVGFTVYWEIFNNARAGYGSAAAVILLLLVLPLMWIQLRRIRQQEGSP